STLVLAYFFTVVTIRPTPRSTLFPYTTLFRSSGKPSSFASITVASPLQPRSTSPTSRVTSLNRLPPRLWYRMLASAREVGLVDLDRKSTRLNSSHLVISYAVFCLNKKKNR